MHRVLIVEDELADLFALTLKVTGGDSYEISVALTGEEGVAAAKRERPDAIIMDLRLPGLNGIEAIQAIREFDRYVPIFAVTAFNSQDTREVATRAGANLYLTKPVDWAILMNHLNQAVNGR